MKTADFYKKYLSLVIVVVLLLTLSVPAMAKSPIKFNEKIQTKKNVIFYEIEISPDSNICGLSLELKYSEDQVKVKNCTVGEILDGGISKSNSTIGGKVVFSYISTTPLKDSGSILLVEFESLSNDNKNISIDCKITECIDKDCNEIAYTLSEKVISNPEYVETAQNKGNPNNDNNHNQTNAENITDNKNGSYKTSNTVSSLDDQKDYKTKKPTNNSNKIESDELINNSGNNSNPLTNNDNSGSELSNSKNYESNKNISKDTDKGVERDETTYMKSRVVIPICSAISLLVVCFMIFRIILLKRRRGNEKN